MKKLLLFCALFIFISIHADAQYAFDYNMFTNMANRAVQAAGDPSGYQKLKEETERRQREEQAQYQKYAKTHKGKQAKRKVVRNGRVVYVPVYYNYPSNNRSNYGNSSRKVTCNGCGGNGRCSGCCGTGHVSSSAYYTGGDPIISNCPICNGTGHCQQCYGRGFITY